MKEKTIWFTADHHYGHANIICFCKRPFLTCDEMDEVMTMRWNEVVEPNDIVYHLGDFTLDDRKIAQSYFRRLNGLIKVIPGGHDKRWLRSHAYFSRDAGVEVRPPLFTLEVPAVGPKQVSPIVLCHYSMRIWDRSHYGSFHLYGHSHGRLSPVGRSMDVGVDAHDFYPVSLGSVIETLRQRRNTNELEVVRSAEVR